MSASRLRPVFLLRAGIASTGLLLSALALASDPIPGFYQEPGRMWRRYFVGNGLFLYRAFREKLRQSSASATASSIR